MADANTHFYELQDVPHGQVHICKYISAVNQHIKECYVYTPPGYDRHRDRSYPVLYLQHGVGENETGWVWQGRMQFIMDNLLYAGKCREMLVVMCSGYAFEPEEDPVFFPGDFDKELTESVIPFIEQEFRCIHNRWGRAVAGLSLGSAQAITECRETSRAVLCTWCILRCGTASVQGIPDGAVYADIFKLWKL